MRILEHLEIKVATTEDLTALEKVGERLFDYPIKKERTVEFLSDPRHHLVLAYDGIQLVGMASGFHYVHPDKDPQLFVNEVSVLEGYRNRGIGRRLVQFLVKEGQRLGCVEAWVATEKSNRAAQKAYLAAGGTESRERVVLYGFAMVKS
ncbi:GNAT family N-acetyltransferase [Flavobacteriaceae bacterium TP-CH-4]|uniref:GNAT family N-acetyltransferase n=1 Tax=Pelagihabitans pacificus TaxID=2696054 RepID=A0A967E5K4_9FLAO|nr:GNAT family N-acetyltransferase [Pelagihabitans pacificus]NHF58680.1 GNAT family N-acetyltransferase [Pelagihabitans pacificus]